MSTPRITFRQSLANTVDREILATLLSEHPRHTEIYIQHEFLQGFGPTRVYLAQPTFETTARNSWILKTGPRDEIEAECQGHAEASAFVPRPAQIAKVAEYYSENTGLIVYDFASYTGKPPLPLEKVLRRVEAFNAVKAVVQLVTEWSPNLSWRRSNLAPRINEWLSIKLERLPEQVQSTSGYSSIYLPDFGRAFSNPLFYLSRGLRPLEVECPYAFQHGDLNFQNVLFNVENGNAPQVEQPIIIDFRHSQDGHIAITDFAKLESCLRYQLLLSLSDVSALQETVVFLYQSQTSLDLGPPAASLTIRDYQELWRSIQTIRRAASGLLAQRRDTDILYWVTLFAYGISTATYTQLPEEIRHLAYLDAAGIFTQHIASHIGALSVSAEQKVVAVHPQLSPTIIQANEYPPHLAYLPLLQKATRNGQAILILGTVFGRRFGVPHRRVFIRNVYKQLMNADPPTDSPELMLDILAGSAPKQRIARVLKESFSLSDVAGEVEQLLPAPWAAIINLHFHDFIYAYLERRKPGKVIRIDTIDDITDAVDDIATGTISYFARYGDCSSSPEALALGHTARQQREHTLVALMRALERRQRPLALVFWQCEEEAIEELVALASRMADCVAVPMDRFFVSDMNDSNRDMTLAALRIWRIDRPLEVLQGNPDEEVQESDTAQHWEAEGVRHRLPNVGALTRGLVRSFEEVGTLAPRPLDETEFSFLLGDPAHVSDIEEGRVVQRRALEQDLMPTIRSTVGRLTQPLQFIYVTGRAGSGVSTLLCHTAHVCVKENLAPVYVAFAGVARRLRDWKDAGHVLADISLQLLRPVLLFLELAKTSGRELGAMAEAIIQEGGQVLIVTGGRKDLFEKLTEEDGELPRASTIELSDTLEPAEWVALARVLQREGFAQVFSETELIHRLETSGLLLPAIYEATDRQNRKFSEIVAYEYHRYDRDDIIQRAYRFICHFGAFSENLSQYWLLKALGDRSLNDASRILNALSEDIVLEHSFDLASQGNPLIGPRHRLIAEEVLNIAVPEPSHRLLDLEQLIAPANLGSEAEGSIVARLLAHKGDLLSWLRAKFLTREEQMSRTEVLYEIALRNKPLHPSVEIQLRQHFALILRRYRRFDEALAQLVLAERLEPENPATLHIMGLVHQSRALAAWRELAHSNVPDENLVRRAQTNEEDSLKFFRKVREQKPSEEYGYESEARYFKEKYVILRPHGTQGISDALQDLNTTAHFQLVTAFGLLRTAESRIGAEHCKELPRTKAELLASLGHAKSALEIVETEIHAATDPVRKVRLLRAAASLAAESQAWQECVRFCRMTIDQGEHDAGLYLLLDTALRNLQTSIVERIQWLRESVDHWNRTDVITLITFAELLCYESNFYEVVRVLERADRASQYGRTIFERERERAVVRVDSPYGTEERRFEGIIGQLRHSHEGFVTLEGYDRGIWFRVYRSSDNLEIGDILSYELALSIRGLKARNVRIERKAADNYSRKVIT